MEKAELISLSNKIRDDYFKKNPLAENLPAGYINNQLQLIYSKDKENNFNTFFNWIKQGYRVRKGEKAYLVWGKLQMFMKPTPTEKEPEKTEQKQWHPVAHIFHISQVDKVQ